MLPRAAIRGVWPASLLRRYEEAGFLLLDLFVVNRTEEGGVLEYDALMMRDRRAEIGEQGGRRSRAPIRRA